MSDDLQPLADAILDQETGLAEGRYLKMGDSLVPAPGRVSPEDVDRWTRDLWRVSRDGRMIIRLAGQIQQVADEMRAAAVLPEIGSEEDQP